MSGETIEAAAGRWQGVIGELAGVDRWNLDGKHRPCPYCGGEDRFRFDDKDGTGSWICNQCGAGYGMDLLMRLTGWEFKEAAREVDSIVGTVHPNTQDKPKTDPRERLRKVAQGATRLTGRDPASKYLHNRGVEPAWMLRLHPNLGYFENGQKVGEYPAMLSLVRDGDGNAVTYHVTYLTEDGRKADVSSPKKILPPNGTITGGAVRLHDAGESLIIAEGIETALAAAHEFAEPAWAALSAHGMESVEIPAGVTSVLVVGDNDENYRGQSAAFNLASRLKQQGVGADIYIPPTSGRDLLDEVVARKSQSAY